MEEQHAVSSSSSEPSTSASKVPTRRWQKKARATSAGPLRIFDKVRKVLCYHRYIAKLKCLITSSEGAAVVSTVTLTASSLLLMLPQSSISKEVKLGNSPSTTWNLNHQRCHKTFYTLWNQSVRLKAKFSPRSRFFLFNLKYPMGLYISSMWVC